MNKTLIDAIKNCKPCNELRAFTDNEHKITVFAVRPMQAANKIYSVIIKEEIADKNEIIIFEFYEKDKNKAHKYSGCRVKMNEPVEFNISDDKTITYQYRIKISKIT